MPRMPFIGVRISWDMLARKALLARLVESARSLAISSSRAACWRSLTSMVTVEISALISTSLTASPVVGGSRSATSCRRDCSARSRSASSACNCSVVFSRERRVCRNSSGADSISWCWASGVRARPTSETSSEERSSDLSHPFSGNQTISKPPKRLSTAISRPVLITCQRLAETPAPSKYRRRTP